MERTLKHNRITKQTFGKNIGKTLATWAPSASYGPFKPFVKFCLLTTKALGLIYAV